MIGKWLMYMAALGALVVVVANPNGVFTAAKSIQTVVGGTETQIISARAKQ